MRGIQRLVLCVVLAVIASVGLTAMSSSATAADGVHQPAAQKVGDAGQLKGDDGSGPSLAPGPNQIASSYCGKANIITPRYCINFSRSEQVYILGAGVTAAGIFICARTGVVGCAAAAAIAYVAITYLQNRGGVCPAKDPVLEVEWFPTPGGYAKCSDG